MFDRFYPQRGASMEPHPNGSHVRFAAVQRLEEEVHELRKLLSQEEATSEGVEDELKEAERVNDFDIRVALAEANENTRAAQSRYESLKAGVQRVAKKCRSTALHPGQEVTRAVAEDLKALLDQKGEGGPEAAPSLCEWLNENIAAHEGMIGNAKGGPLEKQVADRSAICIGIYRKVARHISCDLPEPPPNPLPPELLEQVADYARARSFSTQPKGKGPCETCGGSGWTGDLQGNGHGGIETINKRPCPDCATGKQGEACTNCKGRGYVESEQFPKRLMCGFCLGTGKQAEVGAKDESSYSATSPCAPPSNSSPSGSPSASPSQRTESPSSSPASSLSRSGASSGCSKGSDSGAVDVGGGLETSHRWVLVGDEDPMRTEFCIECGVQRNRNGLLPGRAWVSGGWARDTNCETGADLLRVARWFPGAPACSTCDDTGNVCADCGKPRTRCECGLNGASEDGCPEKCRAQQEIYQRERNADALRTDVRSRSAGGRERKDHRSGGADHGPAGREGDAQDGGQAGGSGPARVERRGGSREIEIWSVDGFKTAPCPGCPDCDPAPQPSHVEGEAPK